MSNENVPEIRFPIRTTLLANSLWVASIAVVYFVFAWLSFKFTFAPTGIAVLCPLAGISLSALLLTRRNLWLWSVGVLFFTGFFAGMLSGLPWLLCLAYSTVQVGAAALSAWLLWRVVGGNIGFDRLQFLISWLLLSVVLANAIAAAIAALTLSLTNPGIPFAKSFIDWFTSDGFGNLLITPFILSWAEWWNSRKFKRDPKRIVEGIILYVLLALICVFAVLILSSKGLTSIYLLDLIFPFMIWAVFRFRVKGAATASIIVAAVTLTYAASGHATNIYLQGSPMEAVFIVQLYLVTIALAALFFATVITERQVNAKKLAEIEQPYELIVANTPDHIIIQDNQLKYTYVTNPQLGLQLEDMIGKTDFDFLPRNDAEKLLKLKRQVLKSGKPLPVEISLLSIAGDTEYFSGTYIPKYDGLGKVDGLIGYLRNVTEQKRVESQRSNLESILNASMNELYIFDAETLHFEFVSAGALHNLGYTMEEMHGMTPVDLKPEFSTTTFQSCIAPLRSHDVAVLNFETVHRRADASTYPVEVHLQLFDQIEHPVFLTVILDITKRKQTEEALILASTRLSFAQHSSGVGVWDWDMLTGKLDWSRELFDLFGLDATAIPSFDVWRSIILPEDVVVAGDRIDQAIREHIPLSNEYRIALPSGEIRWINALGNTNYDDAGEPQRMSGICIDITDRKRSEEALWASEARLVEAQAVSHVGNWEINLSDKSVWASVEAFNIYGIDRKSPYLSLPDIQKLPLLEFRPRLDDALVALIKEKKPYDIEFRIKRVNDGKERDIHSLAHLVTDENGKSVRVVGIIQDITESKQAEEALRESEDKFKYFFGHAVVGMSLTQPSGPIQTNRAFCEMTGYSSDELQTKKWQEITHPDDIELTQKEIDQLLKKEKESVRFVKRFIKKDGAILWTDMSSTVRWDEHGKPLYLMTTLADITERKQLEEVMYENDKRLKSIYETVGDIIFYLTVEPGEQYRFTSVNQAFINVTGLGTEQVINKKVSEVIPEPALSMVLKNYHQAIKERKIVRWEEISEYPTGRLIGDVCIAPVFNQMGICTHLVGTVHDITERKYIEEEINKRNEELSIMNVVNAAANQNKSMASIANLVSSQTKVIFDSLGTTLNLVNPERTRLVMQNSDLPPRLTKAIEKLIGRSIPQIEHDLKADHPYQQVLESKKPLLINDLDGIQEFTKGYLRSQNWPQKTQTQIEKLIPAIVKLIGRNSLMVAPLISNNEVIGTLEVAGSRPYSEEDLRRLVNITGQLTTVIERIQSEARVAEKMDELRRWYEATLGRETRILELKNEVNDLLNATGRPGKYSNTQGAISNE
jgi:PAS domain S-box-containing protein